MPDWAIVLIAAFGGGLAGAVLQPLVTYALQRARAGAEIKKRRERSLRRMLDRQISWGRQRMGLSLLIASRRRSGHPLTRSKINDELDEISDKFVQKPGVAWHPDRIEDRSLKEAACEYHAGILRLGEIVLQPQDHERDAHELEDRMAELERQIVRRMDELNWPEVDD